MAYLDFIAHKLGIDTKQYVKIVMETRRMPMEVSEDWSLS